MLEQEFLISQRELYFIRFSFDCTVTDKTERMRILREFVGDGTLQRVTPDSADSVDPIPVNMFSPEDQAFMDSGGRIDRKQTSVGQGIETLINPDGSIKCEQAYAIAPFVTRYTKKGAGVSLPVHIRLDQLSNGANLPILDENIPTVGSITLGKRSIYAIALDRGMYKLTARLLDGQLLPSNIQVNIEISWNPNVAPK